MNFILPGANVKMLARAVNCFSKIGNELFFEATPDGLDLKTINSTNTAYAVVQFRQDFFISFQQGANGTPDENCCKISMKPILKIFKSLSTIQTCKIWLDVPQSKIIFQFRCKSDVLKTHKIYLLESEHINSVNLSQAFPSEIVGNHKVFANILVHLYHSVDEITFDLKEDKTVVSNYVDNDESDRSTLRSTLAIDTTAFQSYRLSDKTNLTFCYKEFKAITMFAALNKLNVQMSFSQPGAPLMLQMSKANTVQAKFIMGTMQPSAQLNSRRANRLKQGQRKSMNRSVPMDSECINTYLTEDISNTDTTETSQTIPGCVGRTKDTSPIRKTHRNPVEESQQTPRNDTDGNVARGDRSQRQEWANSVRDRARPSTVPPVNDPSSEAMFEDKNTENLPFLDGLNFRTANATPRESPPPPLPEESDVRMSLRPPPLLTPSATANSSSVFSRKRPQPSGTSPGRPAEESVPESPGVVEERKRKQAKLRHIFRRCFEPTFHPAMQPAGSDIFAPNSDSEDDT